MNEDRPDTPHDDEDLDPRLRQMALADPSTGRTQELPEDPEADELLDAHRSGELAPEERRRLEARFRREPALRRRLAQRAGVGIELPEGLRERVLDSLSAKEGRAVKSHAPRWLAAAALLLLGVATVLLLPSRPLPPEVSYRVEVRGLAQTREPGTTNLGTTSSPAEATAGTVVRIVARPERTLSTEVAFGLYRPEAGALRRIPEAVFDLQEHGGAVTLTALGEDLIEGQAGPSTPHVATFYLVVARPGDLRGSIELKPGVSAEDGLSDGGRRRAYPISLRWLPELSPEPSTPGDTEP